MNGSARKRKDKAASGQPMLAAYREQEFDGKATRKLCLWVCFFVFLNTRSYLIKGAVCVCATCTMSAACAACAACFVRALFPPMIPGRQCML
jgi:hypothetical protein